MKVVGGPTKAAGGQIADEDLEVTARWGVPGKGGVTMPGPGKTNVRAFSETEATALNPAPFETGSFRSGVGA
jgi:hypothetical protein